MLRLRSAVVPMLASLLVGCGDTPAAEALRRAAPTPVAVAAEGPVMVLLTPRRAVLQPLSGAGQRRIWRGEGNFAIATEGARVVATAGFRRIVVVTRFEGPDPLDDPRALVGREAFARRSVDTAGDDRDPAGMRFGVSLECTLRGRVEVDWLIVEERCTGGGLSFANRFWASPETGAIVRSEQWAGEDVGTLTLEISGL